jgi:hypothetical protein
VDSYRHTPSQPDRPTDIDPDNRTNPTRLSDRPNQTNKSVSPRQKLTTELGIIQTNLHKSKAATLLLSQKLQENKDTIHVALITEPHSLNRKIPNFTSKHHHKVYPKAIDAPRACIIVNNNLQYLEITELQSRDTTAVLIDTKTATGKPQTIFASVYQPPQHEFQPPTQELRKIVQYASANKLPLIVGCDTNGHHQMWGSKSNNTRGNNLANYILSENLQSVNEGNTPTFVSANGETIIDVTFTTADIANKISNWHVSDEETLSDHRYIRFNLTSETDAPMQYHNPKKTNWNKFRDIMKATLPETQPFPQNTDEIEREVSGLTETLNKAFTKATKTNKSNKLRQTQNNSEWWTPELRAQRTIANRAKRYYDKHKHGAKAEELWHNWHNEKRKFESELRKEKRRSWETYTSNIEQLQEAQRLTKILDKGPTHRINLIKRPDGTSTKNTPEVLQHLLDTHFPGNESTSDENNTHPNTSRHLTNAQWTNASRIITDSKINWAISELQPYKSPGTDKIYPIMLQKSKDIIAENIYNILRACIAYGYIPKAWRESKAIFIPKPGKETYDIAKAFRPISLTSFMLKTLEKIIDRELRDTTLTNYPINPNQHAYHTGRSTETALHTLTTKIHTAINNNEYALCTFFDIAGAFDNAPAKSITNALHHRQANQLITTWITNLLKTRIVLTTKGNTTIKVKATRGCPQGGVLSPLLWCLVVDELLTKLNKKHIDTQAYSDDGTIIVTGKHLPSLCTKTQMGINMAVEWSTKNDLTIHPNKTNMVLFTNKKTNQGWNPPKIGNTPIPLQQSFKYLGIILDSKLTFKEHIRQKCDSTMRTFFQVKQAISSKWGLSPKIVKWIYTTVIRPRMTYAAIIWWERSTYTQEIKSLQKIQRLATTSITGAMKTTPNIALDSITGLIPLHIHIRAEAMKAYIRMKATNSWKSGPSHGHRIIEDYTQQNVIPKEDHTSDLISKSYRFKKNYGINIAHQPEPPGKEDIVYHTFSTRINDNEFTSGAINNELKYCKMYHISKRTTTAKCELLAIQDICTSIATQSRHNFKIICEHPETLKLLSVVNTKSNIILGSIDTLNDTSVNKAISLQIRAPDTPYPTATQMLTIIADNKIGSTYKVMFQLYQGGRITKENIKIPHTDKLKHVCKRNREDVRTLTHILSGHSWLNKHMHTIGISSTPMCEYCKTEEETTTHFIHSCPDMATVRTAIFGSAIITNTTHPISDMDHNKILAFCKQTKRFEEPDEEQQNDQT